MKKIFCTFVIIFKIYIMKIIKLTLKIITFLILFIVLFLIYASVSDYKPELTEIVFETENPDTINVNKDLNLMIWNIGYCGLGEDMDFFYDGGKQVRTSKENVIENFNFIILGFGYRK